MCFYFLILFFNYKIVNLVFCFKKFMQETEKKIKVIISMTLFSMFLVQMGNKIENMGSCFVIKGENWR